MAALPPSKRGLKNVKPDLMIDLSRKLEGNRYHPKTNPDGIIDIGSAYNELMLHDLEVWTRRNFHTKDVQSSLPYNDTQGSPELLQAAAAFVNRHFAPRRPVRVSNVLAASGGTSLLDTVFFNVCDQGDVVLLPTPSYGMFAHDLTTRNEISLCGVKCDDIVDARFGNTGDPRAEAIATASFIERFEKAVVEVQASGKKVAAVLLSNPENPLGRVYSADTLVALAQFCARHRLHLVVDEIYAMSSREAFSSALSVDFGPHRDNVHVLWGLSKDFGLGGLRLGFLITYNKQLYDTMRTLSMFTWVSSFSATLAAKLLSDNRYLELEYFPKFRQRLCERQQYVETQLEKCGIPYIRPTAAFFLFIDLSEWLPTQGTADQAQGELDLLGSLMDHGIFMEPGSAFFSQKPGWFRFNYGVNEPTFVLGMQRLAEFVSLSDGFTKPDNKTSAHQPSRRWRKYLCA